MRPFLALAWRESGRLRPTAFALALLAVLLPAVVTAAISITGGDAELAPALVLFAFVAPACGGIFGATALAGDSALTFARTRPVSCLRAATARILVRALLGAACVGLSAMAILAMGKPPALETLGTARLAGGPVVVILMPLACCLLAAVTVSSFVRRPMLALLGGLALAAIGAWITFRGYVVVGDIAQLGELFVAVAWCVAAVLTVAFAAWRVRRGDVGPWSFARPAVVATGCLLGAAGALHATVAVLATREEGQALRTWTSLAAQEPEPRPPGPADPANVRAIARAVHALRLPRTWDSGLQRRIQPLVDYRQEWWRRDHVTLAEPSPALIDFLDSIGSSLGSARQVLIAADGDDSAAAARPFAVEWFLLHETLMTDASRATLEGRDADAAASLEAAWRALEALFQLPGPERALARTALSRQMKVLRAQTHVADRWSERLARIEPRLLIAEETRLHVTRTVARLRRWPLDNQIHATSGSGWAASYLRPWLRFTYAHEHRTTGRDLVRLEGLSTCPMAWSGRDPAPLLSRAHGVQAGTIALGLELDLTLRAIEVKQVRERQGTVPPSLGPWPVEDCPRLSWTWRVREDGSGVLELSEAVHDFTRPKTGWRPRHVEPPDPRPGS